MQKAAVFVIAILGIVITGLLAALVQQNSRVAAEPQLTTPWSGVLLTNGQAFFGRLEKAGSAFPVLRDVYYVRSQVNQETKQVTNTLVKRGQEWHGPDAMVLNKQHILLIEPVRPDSQMGRLIEENQKTPTPAPAAAQPPAQAK